MVQIKMSRSDSVYGANDSYIIFLEEELDDLYCVACDKLFKSVGAKVSNYFLS